VSRDDDDLDAPADAAEAARAVRFGRRIDDLLAGAPAPAAMDSDERALLRAATQVLAGTRLAELPAARAGQLIDDVLAGARAAAPDARDSASWSASRRRVERAGRALPWAVAAFAAAAAIALLVTRPERLAGEVAARAATPVEQRSRPADPLIGAIPRAEVADARARLDVVYADRLAGFRTRALRGGR
jgi:hypothetical protein